MIKKGFTLIELLIVITIIGILAVAVLSAINPIEQIRRSQDTGKDSDQAELLNAVERYYTAYFKYPWEALGGSTPNSTRVNPGMLNTINELIAKGEVKPEFLNRASWTSIYGTQTGSVVYFCFNPDSKSVQELANNDGRNQNGSTGCISGDCWRCVPR